MDCPKLWKLQMGRPDDYEVNDDDIEKEDYAIQEHLESRILFIVLLFTRKLMV